MGSLTAEMDAMEIDTPAAYPLATMDAFAAYADNEPGDALPFYEAEGRILALWDQLNELKLEIALMEAQGSPPAGALGTGLDEEERPADDATAGATLREAERECLEARAAYTVKQSVVEDVLVAGPVLKAVHAGITATPTERSLRSLIDRRDVLSIASTNLSSILQNIMSNASKVEGERIAIMKRNRELAPPLIDLAREVESACANAIASSDLKDQLDEAEQDTIEARKRWRIMKSVVSAVIAGSGIDWARDDTLRDLVQDNEDDDDGDS